MILVLHSAERAPKTFVDGTIENEKVFVQGAVVEKHDNKVTK